MEIVQPGSIDTSGFITGSGTPGQVAFWDGINSITGTAGFTFDGTYLTLGSGKVIRGQYSNLAGSAYINPDGSAVFASGATVIDNSGNLTATSGKFGSTQAYIGDSVGALPPYSSINLQTPLGGNNYGTIFVDSTGNDSHIYFNNVYNGSNPDFGAFEWYIFDFGLPLAKLDINGFSLTAGSYYGDGSTLSGIGTVTSVGLFSTNSTLTIGSTPVTTSGVITADINLAHSNTWTSNQRFNNELIIAPTSDSTHGVIYQDTTPFIHTYGSVNTFVGNGAGNFTMTGGQNAFFGTSAGGVNTTGEVNTYIGSNAGHSGTTATYNTVLGAAALYFNVSGRDNVAIGPGVLQNNTVSGNVGVGSLALFSNTTGFRNTALGTQALYANTTGFGNFAFGESALRFNTTGNNNLAIGVEALYLCTTGTYNFGIGAGALQNLTTGTTNMAIGRIALNSITTQTGNTAIGDSAGYLSTGNLNTFFGGGAGYQTTTDNNVALGANTLVQNTSGDGHTAVGYGSLVNNSTGTRNTGVGNNSGAANTTGDYNSYLGWWAGLNDGVVSTTNNLSYTTLVGAFAQATASHSLILGGLTAQGFGVSVGINTTAPSAKLHVIETTEQLRLGYDGSNYFKTTVGSAGSTTFALTGTSPKFTFSQQAIFSAGIDLSTQNIVTDTSTGTKIGTATSQKIGLWNTAPNVQPTTAITAASFAANTSGIVDDSATFDGYTIGQVVAALRRLGVLA